MILKTPVALYEYRNGDRHADRNGFPPDLDMTRQPLQYCSSLRCYPIPDFLTFVKEKGGRDFTLSGPFEDWTASYPGCVCVCVFC